MNGTFAEECGQVLEDVRALVDRAESIATLRAKDGRKVGAAAREELAALAVALHEAGAAVSAVVTEVVDDETVRAFEVERERFERMQRR